MFPAYAGMIPKKLNAPEPQADVPRIRGDDPDAIFSRRIAFLMFPAYAGMILRARRWKCVSVDVPRIRGDDPGIAETAIFADRCSPHTRG